MSETFDKLKALLAKQDTLSEDEINQAIQSSGPMTAEERATLDAEVHEKKRQKDQVITMEQYLEASKVLDTAAEGSDEYNKALKIVEAYEKGG